MSDYYCKYWANSFRVTDPERLKKIIENVDEGYLYLDENNGKYTVYGDGPFYSYEGEEDQVEDFFTEDLAKILPEGEAVILQEIGSKKYNYFIGGAYVITHEKIEFISVQEAALLKARELLNNENYDTDI